MLTVYQNTIHKKKVQGGSSPSLGDLFSWLSVCLLYPPYLWVSRQDMVFGNGKRERIFSIPLHTRRGYGHIFISNFNTVPQEVFIAEFNKHFRFIKDYYKRHDLIFKALHVVANW